MSEKHLLFIIFYSENSFLKWQNIELINAIMVKISCVVQKLSFTVIFKILIVNYYRVNLNWDSLDCIIKKLLLLTKVNGNVFLITNFSRTVLRDKYALIKIKFALDIERPKYIKQRCEEFYTCCNVSVKSIYSWESNHNYE